MIEPNHMNVSHIDYTELSCIRNYPNRIKFINDEVDQLTTDAIRVKSTQEWYSYQKLVFAAGSNYGG